MLACVCVCVLACRRREAAAEKGKTAAAAVSARLSRDFSVRADEKKSGEKREGIRPTRRRRRDEGETANAQPAVPTATERRGGGEKERVESCLFLFLAGREDVFFCLGLRLEEE